MDITSLQNKTTSIEHATTSIEQKTDSILEVASVYKNAILKDMHELREDIRDFKRSFAPEPDRSKKQSDHMGTDKHIIISENANSAADINYIAPDSYHIERSGDNSTKMLADSHRDDKASYNTLRTSHEGQRKLQQSDHGTVRMWDETMARIVSPERRPRKVSSVTSFPICWQIALRLSNRSNHVFIEVRNWFLRLVIV